MEQLKLFLEKANQDKELAEKLKELGADAADNDIIALAAEHGFTVTVEDIEDYTKAEGGCGVLSEEDLEKVAGGWTQNRYCKEWCKNLEWQRGDGACDGNNFRGMGRWCDHYRKEEITSIRFRISCAMNAFPPYSGNPNGSKVT